MLRYLLRARHFRLAVVSVCLPYVLMALLVESLHSPLPSNGRGRLPSAQTTVSEGGAIASLNAPPDCPACDWLRVESRQARTTTMTASADAVCPVVPPSHTDWPDGSLPRSTALRGPPSRG